MDLSLVGESLTWSNNWDAPSWSKIDRFLVSSVCKAHFPGVSQRRISRLYSDHFPILLDCGDFRGVVGLSNLKNCG
jgi:endonuclease/exonuclease/phosphatase family metal-dependent hydrolase